MKHGKKHGKKCIAAVMAGILGICTVLSYNAPLSAADESEDVGDYEFDCDYYYDDENERWIYTENILLEFNQDTNAYECGTYLDLDPVYEAVMDFGKKFTLIEDDNDKIGDASLQLTYEDDSIFSSSYIVFTSEGYTTSGKYYTEKTITGYLSDDSVDDDEVPVLKDFSYMIDGDDVILTGYTSRKPDVVIYPAYLVEQNEETKAHGPYNTIVGSTRYRVDIGEGSSEFDEESGEYEGYENSDDSYGSGVFAYDTDIRSVTFLDGVRIQSAKDWMIQSDNIYKDGEYYGYHFEDSEEGNKDKLIQGYLDAVVDGDGGKESRYKDADGQDTVTRIEGPDMKGMFIGCENLEVVKNIPNEVVKMTNTFRDCKKLKTVTNLPSALLDMEKTFMGCENLVEVPQIPENVVNMLGTFRDCKALNPSVPLYIPSSVRNLMETFENCHAMEKTPIVSAKTPVRNLFYTFYRCKKMEQLPVLPESVISMFRTFYGCESAASVVGNTKHVIGNNGSTVPVDLIDTYRGCKKLNADIYIDVNNGLQNNYYVGEEAGYRVKWTSGPTDGAVKSYVDLFGDSTWRWNCYDYFKLWEASKDKAIEQILEEQGVTETTGYVSASLAGLSQSGIYLEGALKGAYRQQVPKGMFWEAALEDGTEIRLHLKCTDDDAFDTSKSNFLNGSRSVSGADGATGITNLSIDRDNSDSLTGGEDIREREEPDIPEPDIPKPDIPEGGKVAVIYNFYIWCYVEQEEKLDHIAITKEPKVKYEVGESFDDEGMEVTAYYRLYIEGFETDTVREAVLNKGDYTLSLSKGKDDKRELNDDTKLKLDDTTVIVSYQDEAVDEPETADLTITVWRKQLEEIKIDTAPDKITYVEGESFEREGMIVKAGYKWYDKDGNIDKNEDKTDREGWETVENYTTDKDEGVLNADDTKVVVSYQDETVDEPKTADQPITVLEKTEKLDSIEITKKPKTKYEVGESFDDEGMEVTAYYYQYIDNVKQDDTKREAVLSKDDYTLSLSKGKDDKRELDDDTKLELDDTTIIVTYQGETADLTITVWRKQLDRIEIVQEPDKTTYDKGESFDRTGMIVEAVYKWYDKDGNADKTEDRKDREGWETVENYTTDKDEGVLVLDDTKVVVTYQGKTADQPITVLGKQLDHIVITQEPDKTTYEEGESFDRTGMVVEAVYKWYDKDGNLAANKADYEEAVDDYTMDKGVLVLDDTKVVVTYQGKTADQPITVLGKQLDHIVITQEPDKTTYEEEESFDRTGMVVEAVYKWYDKDGNLAANKADYEEAVDDYTTDKGVLFLDDTTVVVTYQGKTANQPITVTAKPVTTVAVEGVLRGADNQPLAGYKVELHSDPQTTVTDNNGYYRFETVETGEHTLYVFDKDNKECGTVFIHAEAGKSSATVGNSENMNFNVSVSKETTGDTIHADGVLKVKETESTPSGETESTPSGETESTPSGETESTPSGETESTPSGETESTPSGETESTPSGETESTPSGETESTPSGETQSTPSGETESTPSGETESTPSGETESTPSGETQSTPSGETESAPSSENESTPSEEAPGTGDMSGTNVVAFMILSLSALGVCLMEAERKRRRKHTGEQ